MKRTLLVCLTLLATTGPSAWAGEPAQRSCGWQVKVAGGDQARVGYNDEAARYWGAILPIPAGGSVDIRGRYPHARYLSYHTYTPRLAAIDALADVEISPDEGSTNPFQPGADRTTTRRDYSVRVIKGQVPQGAREPNTLYTKSQDGSESTSETQFVGIVLRVYEPDLGRDDTGDVGLPSLTLVGADGGRTVLPDCPSTGAPIGAVDETLAGSGLAQALPQTDALAYDPPRWFKYVNVFNAQAVILGSNGLGDQVDNVLLDLTERYLPSGGIIENAHNKYIFTTTSQGYGQVVAFRGRLPVTPRTFDGEPVMGTGQMRYWSVCTEQPTSDYLGCLNDDQVPVDADGRYTVIVSTAAARPANAVARCGVAWLPAGPDPVSLLLVRNMLPDPGFAEAIQRIPKQGQEAATMGVFYPHGRYYPTTTDFERLGCPVSPPPAPTVAVPVAKVCSKPRSHITPRLRVGASRRLTVRGSAGGRACRVARVLVSVSRRGKRGCRPVTASGRLGRSRPCSRRVYLPGAGSSRWRAVVKRALPVGRYVVHSRAIDRSGSKERRATRANTAYVTVRARTSRARGR